MGFYGNISNAGKTNLTFDKIYPNRYTMLNNAKTDNIFIGRFVLVEYDDNTFSRRRGYKNSEEIENRLYSDQSYQKPYYLNSNTKNGYGLIEGDLVFTEKNGVYTYYRCNGKSFETDGSAMFDLIQENNKNLSDYTINYEIDKLNYSSIFTNGWDSTIWQKTIVNGEETYKMIASLNSITPSFEIVAEAPKEKPIAPRFGQNSTNINYTLHMPTNYGFRIKETEDKKLSDENYKILIEDEEGNIEEETKYLDIYYNANALKSENKLERIYSEEQNKIMIAPTGVSGNKYYDEEQGIVKTENDIQELSIRIPSLGNIASEFWDLMYGDKDKTGNYKDKRNDNISWNSLEGIRMISEDLASGGFGYNPEKVESVAGVINSVHDLMGMIVYPQTSLENANLNSIYYREYPEEGEENFRPGFFIKVPAINFTSFEELGINYKDYIGGKKPYYLTQYIPNYYYTVAGSGVKDKFNYYCEINSQPTSDTKYYTMNESGPILVELMEWVSSEEEDTEEKNKNYYYKEFLENGNLYGYVKDTNDFADITKDYYEVEASEISSIKFFEHEIIKYTNSDGMSHKYREENGQILYSGYFYYDDEQKVLVPLYNNAVFKENEQYYLIRDYIIEPAGTVEGDKDAYYLSDGTALTGDFVKNNISLVVNLIKFESNKYFQLNKEGTIYLCIQDIKDIIEGGQYFFITETLITGEIEKEETEDNPSETIYTHFYVPDQYYYKTKNNDYILDRGKELQKDKEYYILDSNTFIKSDITFYEPNKYYYFSKSKQNDRLDDSIVMRTVEDEDVVIQYDENNDFKEFIYYLKLKAYVISDDTNHLNKGSVWNVNGEPPKGVILGVLNNEYFDKKEYEWKELKGFARTLNTINGLILQLNKIYRFDDELIRDTNTIQGTLNTLRDYFAKFDILTPNQILAVNAYGQLDSQNPGELTLTNYEVAEGLAAITEEDTLNSAFGKLEYKLNVLNGNASVEGSVANQINDLLNYIATLEARIEALENPEE